MHSLFSRMAKDGRTPMRQRPPLRYEINKWQMSAPLLNTFVQSTLDTETAAWLEEARQHSVVKSTCSNLLTALFSRTTANAMCFRGSMFVLSTANADRLLGPTFASRPPAELSMIDIGAGDGGVTKRVAHMFGSIFATEASYAMQLRLRSAGYTVQDAITGERAQYDLVSCLNVLDRCDKPLGLLREMRDATAPGGKVLLAVVLSWCPFVEDGPRQKAPTEALPMAGGGCREGATFEASVETLVANVIVPTGFVVEAWTGVPFLCEGSPTHEHYALDDAVFVLSRADVAADTA